MNKLIDTILRWFGLARLDELREYGAANESLREQLSFVTRNRDALQKAVHDLMQDNHESPV